MSYTWGTIRVLTEFEAEDAARPRWMKDKCRAGIIASERWKSTMRDKATVLRSQVGSLICAMALAVVYMSLSGCGGSDENAAVQTGRLTVSVTWPAPETAQVQPQVVPGGSHSIHVQVEESYDGGWQVVAEALLVRPTAPPWVSEAHFDVVRSDPEAKLTADAYPNEDGTGVVQACAEMMVVIPVGGDGYPYGGNPGDPVNLVLGSTIVEVQVAPDPLEVVVRQSGQLVATAKDADGNVVLVPATNAFTWTVEDTRVVPPAAVALNRITHSAEIDQEGNVTGLSMGPATATATENDSGVSGDAAVAVLPQLYAFAWDWRDPVGGHGLLDVAAGPNDSIYVGQHEANVVYTINALGKYVGQWPCIIYGMEGPTGLAHSADGHVYVTYHWTNRLEKRDEAGQLLNQWGDEQLPGGPLFGPTGITTDASGRIYVADTMNSRVVRYAADGTYLDQWGSEGFADGKFRGCADVAVDGAGNVYATDYVGNRVQKFDSAGGFLGWWGKDDDGYIGWHEPASGAIPAPGDEPGAFENPRGIAVGGSGDVYVVDAGNCRVEKFSPIGATLSVFGEYAESPSGPGQFDDPGGVDVDVNGNVYVADTDNDRVQKFSPAGEVDVVIH